MAAFYLLTLPHLWQCEGLDEIDYLGLAHSLVRGQGYTLYGQPYVLYPPLYPFVLAFLMRYGAGVWVVFYAANAVFGLCGVILGSSWLRARFGRIGAWAGWFALLSYYAWSFSTRFLLSEPLFMALSVPTVILAYQLLEYGKGSFWKYLLIGTGVLLSAMTRFGAVALLGGLVFASVVQWLRTRSRSALYLAVICLLLGGGFTAGWDIRGRMVNPNAAESYSRWVKRSFGYSKGETGIIARSAGEGTSRPLSWPSRVVVLGNKCSQYVLSVVRPPRNFAPLAILLWAVLLTGLLVHLRQFPGSAIGWYTASSLAIISLTSWLSSYIRYFFPLTPFLFYFLLLGARAWYERLMVSEDWLLRMVTGLLGIGGVGWSLWRLPDFETGGAEAAYGVMQWSACVIAYGLMLVVGASAWLRRKPLATLGQPSKVFVIAVIIYGLHSALIAGERFKLTRENHMLGERNLLGAVEAGQWIRKHSGPESICAASLPRLVSFLSDRTCLDPKFAADGSIDTGAVRYILCTGLLKDMPAFSCSDEERLRVAIEKTPATEVFRSGDALVYEVKDARGQMGQ